MPTTTQTQISEPRRAASEKTVGRLFFLDASVDGRVVSVNADGSDRKVIVDGCRIPDGIVVDLAAGHIYWTNMGVPSENDGSIERADLDGQNRRTVARSRRALGRSGRARGKPCVNRTSQAASRNRPLQEST